MSLAGQVLLPSSGYRVLLRQAWAVSCRALGLGPADESASMPAGRASGKQLQGGLDVLCTCGTTSMLPSCIPNTTGAAKSPVI